MTQTTDNRLRALERIASGGDSDAIAALEGLQIRHNFALPGFESFMGSRILLLGARWHYEGILLRCEGAQLIMNECRQIFNYTKENGVSAADDLPGETSCNSDHVSATCLSFFADRPKVRGDGEANIGGSIAGYHSLLNKRILLLGARWHYDGDLIGCSGDQLLLRNCRMIFNYTLEEGISASDTLMMSDENKSKLAEIEAARGVNIQDGNLREGIVACNWKHVASASNSPFPFGDK